MGYITEITDQSSRHFTNLFSVSVETENSPEVTNAYSIVNKRCFSIDFGGDFSIDYDYNDNMKMHFLRKANLIKTATLYFYEDKGMNCIKAFETDFNSLWDKEKKCFKQGIPNRDITITLDGTARLSGVLLSGMDGNISVSNAKIQTYKYPKYSWKDKEPAEVSVTYSFDKISFVQPNKGLG